MDMAECPTCGYESSDHGVKLHHSKSHGESYYCAIIRQKHGVEPDNWLKTEHHDNQRPLADIANELGTDASTVAKMCRDEGVGTRSYSQARKTVWESKSEQEREEMVKAAHEKTRQLVESGEHNFQDPGFERVLTEEFLNRSKDSPPKELFEWWNGKEHLRKEFGAKGAANRQKNGMEGKTGQDNPNWRGGKSIYDAIKKQLHGKSWSYLKNKFRKDECYNCGEENAQHDLHHIIPIMCGGTNEKWNLMTLCSSCHRKAELFIRQYDEFSTVFVE